MNLVYCSCPQVGYDEADLGVTGFSCSHARSTMVKYTNSLQYGPYHWITRAPHELLPIWNMLGIFDYYSWFFIFISMVGMYGFLWVTAKLGACYGLDYHYQEIPLCPIR